MFFFYISYFINYYVLYFRVPAGQSLFDMYLKELPRGDPEMESVKTYCKCTPNGTVCGMEAVSDAATQMTKSGSTPKTLKRTQKAARPNRIKSVFTRIFLFATEHFYDNDP